MLDLSMYSGWEKMRKISAIQEMAVSTVLFRQGSVPQSATLVENGWVKLVRLEQDGQEQIIALYPPGSLLGAEILISDQCHTASAITMTNCRLYMIPASAFLNWIRTDLQFSWQIHRAFSQRINARDLSAAQSRCVPSRLRLEQLLWQLLYAQNHNGVTAKSEWWLKESKLFLPLQRQELAQMISVTPEHLSRLLKIMEKDQVIRRDNGWLIIPSPFHLWRAPEIKALIDFDQIQSGEPDLPDIIIA
jgi:CRP/FNR family transcriptional regulator